MPHLPVTPLAAESWRTYIISTVMYSIKMQTPWCLHLDLDSATKYNTGAALAVTRLYATTPRARVLQFCSNGYRLYVKRSLAAYKSMPLSYYYQTASRPALR